MTTETCPHCGAAADDSNFWTTIYKCGTAFEYERTSTCYERQLSAKDAEIERLRNTLEYLLSESEGLIHDVTKNSWIIKTIRPVLEARGEVK